MVVRLGSDPFLIWILGNLVFPRTSFLPFIKIQDLLAFDFEFFIGSDLIIVL
uniref:Uncharacterized protein n=1 Tax=Nelumbo nucifera TaxID=4432 RepID=A0A822YUN5_NELNU|nr:TPA_asm: hypothetical protein HUJ06_007033 [Nelumbo nucifera]